MTTYQQFGPTRGYTTVENGFHFSQTAAVPGPTKQTTFSFRKRFERIDWKRLGKLFTCLVIFFRSRVCEKNIGFWYWTYCAQLSPLSLCLFVPTSQSFCVILMLIWCAEVRNCTNITDFSVAGMMV